MTHDTEHTMNEFRFTPKAAIFKSEDDNGYHAAIDQLQDIGLINDVDYKILTHGRLYRHNKADLFYTEFIPLSTNAKIFFRLSTEF
jgi:hypothetical protein